MHYSFVRNFFSHAGICLSIQLYDCIQNMRSCTMGSQSHHQEVLIKRYYEIHFDYSTEFKNTSVRRILLILLFLLLLHC